MDIKDCNWPTTDGSWLNRFVPEKYVYQGGGQVVQLEKSSLDVVKSSNIAARVRLENDIVKIEIHRAFGNRRLSEIPSLPDDIDIHLSKLFSQVAAATAASEQEEIQALPIVIEGQTTEKFLYLGTNKTEAFNLIPGSMTTQGGTLVYTLGGDDEVGINGGVNLFDGGSGTDTATYVSTADSAVIVDVGVSTNQTATVKRTINPDQNTDQLYNVERIIGTPQSDTFNLHQASDKMELDAGDGAADLLDFTAMTGWPIVNVQYGRLELSKQFIEEDWSYYYQEDDGNAYYSNDYDYEPNIVTLKKRVSDQAW